MHKIKKSNLESAILLPLVPHGWFSEGQRILEAQEFLVQKLHLHFQNLQESFRHQRILHLRVLHLLYQPDLLPKSKGLYRGAEFKNFNT